MLFTILFVVALALPILKAEPNNVTVCDVNAQGKNREEAVKNALHMAVSQVRGVRVGSGSYRFGYAGATADVNGSKASGKTIDFDAVSIEASGTTSITTSGGLVKKYEVLEEKQAADGVAIRVRAWVYNLADSEKSKRIKIAVMPVKTMPGRQYTFAAFHTPQNLPAENLAAILAHNLTVSLVETNKFDVLDRDNMVDFAREAKMLLVFDASLSEQAKLVETMGGDFLLVSTIAEASVDCEKGVYAATGQPRSEYVGRFVFNYSLIKSTTKQVENAGTVEIVMENEEFAPLMRKSDPTQWSGEEMRDRLVETAAYNAAKAISESIYPVKVVGIEKGQVVVDHAGTKLPVGTELGVFKCGKEFFDVDTKQSLGKSEDRVATLRIVKVSQKVSFADVIDGSIKDVAVGQICRAMQIAAQDHGRQSDIKRTGSGGVELPFDK
jgi:hypothetical protein